MISRSLKIVLVASVLVFIAMIAGYYIARNILTHTTVTFSFNNISEVVIKEQQEGKDPKTVAKLQSTGETARLSLYKTYTLDYSGSEGYANGTQTIYVTPQTKAVTLQTYYSEERLAQLLPSEQNAINSAIATYLAGRTDYSVNQGKLLGMGDLYGTTLPYKGTNVLATDTLRIVVQKKGNSWQVVNIPEIVVTKATHPGIDIAILNQINAL